MCPILFEQGCIDLTMSGFGSGSDGSKLDGCPKQRADSAGQRSTGRAGFPRTLADGASSGGPDIRTRLRVIRGRRRRTQNRACVGKTRLHHPEACFRGHRRQLSGPTLASSDFARPNPLSQETGLAKQLSPLRHLSAEPPTNYVAATSKPDI